MIADYGIFLEIFGFFMMLEMLLPSVVFELYFMKKHGLKWREKTWKQSIIKDHKFGIMTLFGKQVPALTSSDHDYVEAHSKFPDKMKKWGIFLIIFGLILQHSEINNWFFNNFLNI